METLATDFIEPSWMQEEQFVVEKIFAFMEPDSLPTSRPISIDSTNPADIFQMFDSITYDKGATLIRMMSMFLGAETFQRGVRTYLKALSFGSATQQDLWRYLSEATNNMIDVERIMDGWTRQAGYPIVEVNRLYNTAGARMVISQRPFSLFSTTPKQDKWWIPFKYFDQTFTKVNEVVWLNDTSATLNITTADSDWLLANPGYLGIYRTKYDSKNFRLIVTQLQTDHTRIPTITRGALIDDTFALSRTGLINATDAYELIRYLKSETEFVPWIAALSAMGQQEELLADRSILIDVQRYFLELVLPIYNTIGWVPIDQSTEWLRTLLQPSIVSAACHYGHPDCIEAARSAYRRWTLNPTLNQIPADLRSIVYCTVVREGSRTEFNFLWARLQKELIASETLNLLEGLACTKDPSLIVWFLDQNLMDESIIRDQDSPSSIADVARSPRGNQIVWNWIRDNWSTLFEKWGNSDNNLDEIIEAISNRFVTVRQRDEFKTFADSIIDKGKRFEFILSQHAFYYSLRYHVPSISIVH
jgi:aminopeptidase N